MLKKLDTKNQALYDVKQPIPNERNKYCSVCRTKFIDYLEHINSVEHGFTVANESIYNEID